MTRNPQEESAVKDDWGQDCARRAKAALVDTTVANPARVGDYLCGDGTISRPTAGRSG